MEITQNLHRQQYKDLFKIKTSFLFVLILWSCAIFSQDDIVAENTINEQKKLEFQEFFFDALTQKAINNHQRAIEKLEECNLILPNDKSVLFELSKNYLKLNKTPEALTYINEALVLEPTNLWLLEHLVAIHKKDKNYTEAIIIQEKIAKKNPKKRQEVVYLHLRNRDNGAAKKVLAELAKAKLLNARLRRIRTNLTKPKEVKKSIVKANPKGSLEEEFTKEKSFTNLKQLLSTFDKENNSTLLQYSIEGMSLFPAQPIVYLMNGKALNKQKEYKKAIKSLQNGIDFVIDDLIMEKRFYTQLLVAYKGIGDKKNIAKYQKKI